MKTKIKLELKPETYEALKLFTGKRNVITSIGFIKRYIFNEWKTGFKRKSQDVFTANQ